MVVGCRAGPKSPKVLHSTHTNELLNENLGVENRNVSRPPNDGIRGVTRDRVMDVVPN